MNRRASSRQSRQLYQRAYYLRNRQPTNVPRGRPRGAAGRPRGQGQGEAARGGRQTGATRHGQRAEETGRIDRAEETEQRADEHRPRDASSANQGGTQQQVPFTAADVSNDARVNNLLSKDQALKCSKTYGRQRNIGKIRKRMSWRWPGSLEYQHVSSPSLLLRASGTSCCVC